MPILLTGFEPFDGNNHNPSATLARHFNNKQIAHHKLLGRVLPVDTVRAPKTLLRLLQKHKPSAVVMLGLAQGRPNISLETTAKNILNFSIPDNAGQIASGEIVMNGPKHHQSSLPIGPIKEQFQELGIDCHISNDAGEYLCNQIFYLAQHTLAKSGIPSGFVHLPSDEKLGTWPFLTYSKQKLAITSLLTSLINSLSDS